MVSQRLELKKNSSMREETVDVPAGATLSHQLEVTEALEREIDECCQCRGLTDHQFMNHT